MDLFQWRMGKGIEPHVHNYAYCQLPLTPELQLELNDTLITWRRFSCQKNVAPIIFK